MARIPGPGRNPLPQGEVEKLFNCYLSRRARRRLKVICFRQSVIQQENHSEGAAVEGAILACPLPRPPKAKEVAAAKANPSKRLQRTIKDYEEIEASERDEIERSHAASG